MVIPLPPSSYHLETIRNFYQLINSPIKLMDLSGRRDRSKRIWPLGDPEQSSPSARLRLAQISASFDWKETDRALFDSSVLSTGLVGKPIAEAPACSASFSSGSGDGTGVARPLTFISPFGFASAAFSPAPTSFFKKPISPV